MASDRVSAVEMTAKTPGPPVNRVRTGLDPRPSRCGPSKGSTLMRRVVVTGMGMVSPVGRDLEQSWSALLEGRSGVGPITLFDAETFPTRIAAEAVGFDLADYITDADRWSEYCRNTQFAIAAARM